MNHQSEITKATRRAPDQSIHARQHITAALAESSTELIDPATARIIAASIHSGYGTALCVFAATGVLHPERARAELKLVEVDTEQEGWVDALARYFLFWDGLPKGERS